MRIAILASGSRGDIQPILAVGDALRERGHSVVLTVNPTMVSWARRTGLEIVETPFDLETWWKSPQGQGLLAAGDSLRVVRALRALEEVCAEGMARSGKLACADADLVVSTLLTTSHGVCHAEALGVPHVVMLTFPLHPTGEFSTPLGPVRTLGLPALNRAMYELFAWAQFRAARAALRVLRRELGLPPLRGRLRAELAPAVVLCSPALLPRPKDWGAHVALSGSPRLSPSLRARLGEAVTPDGLETWLSAGPPPVYFGFGSMPVRDPQATLGQIAEVSRRLGQRALIAAGWSSFGQTPLPPHLFLAPMMNHDEVLPRCRAAVHHGGAGTTAAVARAGLPSVVASVAFDQTFWGWRLQQLGAGVHRPFRTLTEDVLERSLEAVLSPAQAVGAQALAASMRDEEGAGAAAEALLAAA